MRTIRCKEQDTHAKLYFVCRSGFFYCLHCAIILSLCLCAKPCFVKDESFMAHSRCFFFRSLVLLLFSACVCVCMKRYKSELYTNTQSHRLILPSQYLVSVSNVQFSTVRQSIIFRINSNISGAERTWYGHYMNAYNAIP